MLGGMLGDDGAATKGGGTPYSGTPGYGLGSSGGLMSKMLAF